MSRSLQPFAIVLEGNQKKYTQGDTISGNVVVNARQKKKFHSITLTVKGEARIRWDKKECSGDPDPGFCSNDRFTANETYLDCLIYLAGGSGRTQELQPGHYEFPFSLKFPHSPLPSSIDNKYGSVKYWLWAQMDRPWRTNHTDKLRITVVECVRLHQDQVTNRPWAVRQEANLFRFPCSSGPIILTATTDREGYCSGESIQVIAHLDNNSHARVRGMKATLERKVEFNVKGSMRIVVETVTQMINLNGIAAGQSFDWNVLIPISEICIPTSSSNSLIKVGYTLLVEAILPFFHSPMKTVVPIFIGTVPPSLGDADATRRSTAGGTLNTAERVRLHVEHLFEQAEITPLNPMPQVPVEILPPYNPEISNPEPFNP